MKRNHSKKKKLKMETLVGKAKNFLSPLVAQHHFHTVNHKKMDIILSEKKLIFSSHLLRYFSLYFFLFVSLEPAVKFPPAAGFRELYVERQQRTSTSYRIFF